MPGYDRTGPEGQGPMTGRKMGRCTNYGAGRKKKDSSPEETRDENPTEGQSNQGFERGRGKGGRGRGLGRQNRFRGGN